MAVSSLWSLDMLQQLCSHRTPHRKICNNTIHNRLHVLTAHATLCTFWPSLAAWSVAPPLPRPPLRHFRRLVEPRRRYKHYFLLFPPLAPAWPLLMPGIILPRRGFICGNIVFSGLFPGRVIVRGSSDLDDLLTRAGP